MKAITAAWLAAALDDLRSIELIRQHESLTNVVAFHAQQVIEKSFKAVLEEREGSVPKMHNLETLLPKVSPHLVIDGADFELLEDLDKLCTDARYPGDFGLLPNGKPTITEAAAFYELALLVYTTINNSLK